MASVIDVYNGVKNLINKEQKGFVTSKVFNSFAQSAQTNIFNSILEDQIKAKQIAKQGVDVGDVLSIKNRKKEDINWFVREKQLLLDEDNKANKPNYATKVISVYDTDTVDDVGGTDNLPYFELFDDPHKIKDVLNSHLSAPSTGYGIAYVSSDSIKIYGSEATSINVVYYTPVLSKKITDQTISDSSPVITFTEDGNEIIINPDQCYDFILPDSYVSELIYEVARMIGVRLRDQDIVAYTQQKVTSDA